MNPIRRSGRAGVWSAIALLLGGCTAGPKYVRPPADAPANYKETGDWKPAQPGDQLTRGKWWEIYGDAQLDSFEEQISISNQTLKAAQARFIEARAGIRVSRAGFFPSATAGLSVSRTRPSQNRPPAPSSTPAYNDFLLPVDVSYEPDVWGRVRRTVEAARAEAQASAADLAGVELSLRAELALDYFQLRGVDSQRQLLASTVAAYEKALELTESRYHGGLASAVDVAQAQTQLETTRAQAADLEVQRTAFEHAIAVLTGRAPYQFAVPPLALAAPPPAIPPGLPSDLLERRPDIAAAERRVQEANAQIGVARAAWFPRLLLSGVGGFESAKIGTLLQGPGGFWSLAGSAAELVIDGGQRRGLTEAARASYDQSVDTYRQATLAAFEEVEDNLSALRILQDVAKTQDAAVAAAQHSLALSTTRYQGGVTSYLEVVTAQRAALSDESAAVDILTRRMVASVLLIKALGGGWNVSQILPL